MFTISEEKIIRKIKQFIANTAFDKTYNFWFVYNNNNMDIAINWEGGYELSEFAGFRNDYRIKAVPGKYQITKTPLQ